MSVALEVNAEDARWGNLEPVARRAIDAGLRHLGQEPARFEVSVLACDDARIAGLNTEFRAKALPTNVLSWPSWDLTAETRGAVPEPPEPGTPDDPELLGDIALAYETCAREAGEQGKPFEAHVTHLIVHSLLHLLGYDHQNDEDADLMEKTEALILAQLGIGDPYAEEDPVRPDGSSGSA